MSKARKILIYSAVATVFVISLIVNTPAWVMGSMLGHYSGNRVSTINEQGSFWNGTALLQANDKVGKKVVPIIMIGWQIKFGFKKFVTVNLTASNQTIAAVSLTKNGIAVNNVNLALSLDQLTPFMGNLNTLNLSGSVRLSADNLLIGKKMQGSVNLTLNNVGSGISPINPIGSYQVSVDLASQALDVSTTDANSVISVTGSGSTNSLTLNSKVQPDKKEQLLQFMTMMGIPQADGSYQLKAI